MALEYDGPAGTEQEERDAYIFAVVQASKVLLRASKGHKTARSRLNHTLRPVIVCWYDHANRHSHCPTHAHSDAARKCRIHAKGKIAGTTYEHVIPMKLIAGELLDREWVSPAEIRLFLDRFYKTCRITIEENRTLNGQLRQTMPDGWSWETGDIWARYLDADIGVPAEERK